MGATYDEDDASFEIQKMYKERELGKLPMEDTPITSKHNSRY
jgi:hypothetical protein